MLPIFQIILVCGYTGTPVTADYDMLVQEIELQKDLSVSAATFKSSPENLVQEMITNTCIDQYKNQKLHKFTD